MGLNNKNFASGIGLKVYRWLSQHALKYGFCQPYKLNPKTRSKGKYILGYQEEKWHWSYYHLAKKYQKDFLKKINVNHLTGFAGSKKVSQLFQSYVDNVHWECK